MQLRLGEVTIASIVERDGPWRNPEAMFPTAGRVESDGDRSRYRFIDG